MNWNVSIGDWSDTSPCPWNPPLEPADDDDAYIENGGTANVTQPDETCSSLYLGGANSGTVQMTDGNLTTDWEYVGNSGTGTFTQSGGTNTILMTGPLTSNLYLGYNTGSSGTYNLSGSGQLSAYYQFIGVNGTGTFSQSGGTNLLGDLHIGGNLDSSGTYNLSGSGEMSADYEFIGGDGNGIFNQSGGTNTIFSELDLGNGWGNGIYSISNGTLDVRDGSILVGGISRTGQFNLNGGLVIANQFDIGSNGSFSSSGSGTLRVNYLIGSADNFALNGTLQFGHSGGFWLGIYSVDSNQSLTVSRDLTVGYDAPATFTLSGTNTVYNNLYLGHLVGGEGTYNLNGTGVLAVAGDQYVGFSGTGASTNPEAPTLSPTNSISGTSSAAKVRTTLTARES